MPDLDVPPGLGIRPEEQLSGKLKAKNPRRRAKKAAEKYAARGQEADGAIFLAPTAPSVGEGHIEGKTSAEGVVLEPSTQSLLSLIRSSGSSQRQSEHAGNLTEPATDVPDVPYSATGKKKNKKNKTDSKSTQKMHNLMESSSVPLNCRSNDALEDHRGLTSGTSASPALASAGLWLQNPPQGAQQQSCQSVGALKSWEDDETLQTATSKSWDKVNPRPSIWDQPSDTQHTLPGQNWQLKGRIEEPQASQSMPGQSSSGQKGYSSSGSRTTLTHHWSKSRLQKALKKGRVLRCEFRANAADRRQGFAGLEGLPADIQIQGLENQNRAIMGDAVAVELLPQAEWLSQRVTILKGAKMRNRGTGDKPRLDLLEETFQKLATAPSETELDDKLSKATGPEQAKQILIDILKERHDLRATGRVVAILEPSFRRQRMVGALQRESWGYLLVPVDPRMPKGRVIADRLPDKLVQDLKVQEEEDPESWVLVSALVESWPAGSYYPNMVVRESLGQAGEIEVETRAILENEGVDLEDFDEEVLQCLPPTPWQITDEEVAKRRDLRNSRLFTIDPLTARDLDDALSIEDLGSGRWRVGVHIADVSHFIPAGSALDAKATKRATSVYLVQRVIPMLPSLLCEELCSLNPGTDRLAFSVIWELDEQGNVHAQWTGRTIIRSCVKLAYSHAQAMIDGTFTFPAEGLPALQAPHRWEDVVGDVLALNRIARNCHRRRFENGALRLNNVKLSFSLDDDGNPSSCEQYEQRESNELVAEFMLLANMSVAQLIGSAFRDKGLLRRHQTPEERKMGELEEAAEKLGYDIDCTTAGSIQESLQRLRKAGEDPVVIEILQLMATKPMKQAQYFSTGTYERVADWRHFALAVPMYTHFTSPIRRYPDVIVHRLLTQLLKDDSAAAHRMYNPGPLGSIESDVAEIQPAEEATAAAAVRQVLEEGGELELPGEALPRGAVAEDAMPAPKLFAKKVGDSNGGPGKNWAQTRQAGYLPVSTTLLDSEELAEVAKHCNERKTSAKACSDASSRLYLCLMLRAQPRVLESIVTVVNGNKFFDLYIPTLGIEARVYVSEMLPAMATVWNRESRVLFLSEKEGSSAAPGEEPVPCLESLRNADKLDNQLGLQPLELPLEIKAFAKIPVVATAKSPGIAQPLASFALLYIKSCSSALPVVGAEVTEVHLAQPDDGEED